MTTKSFKDLIVWQKAKELAVEIYSLTSALPREELYGLTSQMWRAVISISSNIAESYHRFHSKEKGQLMSIAFGSGPELESRLEIAKMSFPGHNYKKAESILSEVMRILNKFLS